MTKLLEFTKLHGAGNDFIFFEDLNNELIITPEQAQALCNRHFGIGADGIIVVKPSKDSNNAGYMHYINSDGTLAQMCGNGIRCFAKYLVDHRIIEPNTSHFNVETLAGIKTITYVTNDNQKLIEATVDMGKPILQPALIPTLLAANATTSWGEAFTRDVEIKSPFGSFAFTCVSMGNPHAVTFVDDCNNIDINRIGAWFESCTVFPEKANIEFATVHNNGISMRVFERGCSETLACGTGACATNIAAFLTGRASAENDIILQGGVLHINYIPGKTVMMTGPAAESFTGVIKL